MQTSRFLEVGITKTVRLLLVSAALLLTAGWFVYHSGSQLNLAVPKEEMLWEQAPGDIWLYVGGIMMLISGSLAVAAVKVWRGNRREATTSSLDG